MNSRGGGNTELIVVGLVPQVVIVGGALLLSSFRWFGILKENNPVEFWLMVSAIALAVIVFSGTLVFHKVEKDVTSREIEPTA
jgi:hypothetical protein